MPFQTGIIFSKYISLSIHSIAISIHKAVVIQKATFKIRKAIIPKIPICWPNKHLNFKLLFVVLVSEGNILMEFSPIRCQL